MGFEYNEGATAVSTDGKTLTVSMILWKKAKGVALQKGNVSSEAELTDELVHGTAQVRTG